MNQIARLPIGDRRARIWSGDGILFPSPLLFIGIILGWIAVFLWVRALPIRIDWSGSIAGLQQAAILYLPGAIILLRLENLSWSRYQHIYYKVGICLCGLAAVSLVSPLVALTQTLLMLEPRAFWDDILVQPELWVGFDWNAYYQTVATTDPLREALNISYRKLALALLLTMPLTLALRSGTHHCKVFICANILSVTICAFIGSNFPVEGTVHFYAPEPNNFDIYGGIPGSYHMPVLDRLWSEDMPLIDTAKLVGLIAFPSYHTAAAILVSIALYRTILFPIALVFTVLSIAATPINGSHYLIDLVAGGLQTWLLVWLLYRAFRPDPERAA